MLAKKLVLLTAALAISAPALADRGNHYGHYKHYGHGKRMVVQERHYYHPAPPRRVVVVHRPAPVIYHQPYHQPAPVYHARMEPGAGAALLVGAVLGAAIVHHAIVTRY